MPIYFRNIPITEPFTYESIGNHWNQDRMTRLKGYPVYHYLQTEKGIGRIEIQGKEYTLSPNQGVLTAPFIPHSYSSASEEWITTFITFTGTMESSIAKIVGNRQIVFTDEEQGLLIAPLIAEIIEKHTHPPLDTKSISVDCYRLLMHFANGMYTRELLKEPLYQRYVEPVMREIEQNYSLGLTIQTLSSQVYVTPQYLSRLFNRFLGCSAYEYLTTYRINKAKEFLLTDSRIEVQEVAQRTGFPDASHFIAMFKKTTGMTPGEFRRLN